MEFLYQKKYLKIKGKRRIFLRHRYLTVTFFGTVKSRNTRKSKVDVLRPSRRWKVNSKHNCNQTGAIALTTSPACLFVVNLNVC